MHSTGVTLIRKLKGAWQSAVESTVRIQGLLAFGFYLMLWSKVFKGHHFLEPVEEALLALSPFTVFPRSSTSMIEPDQSKAGRGDSPGSMPGYF